MQIEGAPQIEEPPQGGWIKLKNRLFSRGGGSGKMVDPVLIAKPEVRSEEPAIVESDTKQSSIQEFLAHKFLASVGELEQDAAHAESATVKLEEEAYLNLRKEQVRDRSGTYAERVPLESYVILSDQPSDDEKVLVQTMHGKSPVDMDYPELAFTQALFNPDYRQGNGILSLLAIRIAAKERGLKPDSFSKERIRGNEVSRLRTVVSQRRASLKSEQGYGNSDSSLEALCAKDVLIDRVRDGYYS